MTTNLNFRVSKVLLGQFEKSCTEQGLNKSEVLRSLMAEFVRQNQKEASKMIEVVIIEAGVDYTDRLGSFMMEAGGDVVEKAIAAVEAEGYTVIPNTEGGQNELCTVTGGSDYIAVTVEPK